jgi:hypothetical protein
LKGKKGWTTARPIIAFSGTTFSKLWKCLGRTITQLSGTVFANQVGEGRVFTALSDLHQALVMTNTGRRTLINQDLTGFFTSVPQERIIKAVKFLLNYYFNCKHEWDTSSQLSICKKREQKYPWQMAEDGGKI